MDEHSTHPSDGSAPTESGSPATPAGDTVARMAAAQDTAAVNEARAEAAAAGEVEVTDKTKAELAPEFELVTLEHRGMKWDVPKHRGQWDMNVQFEFEEGNRLRGYCVLLGGSPANIAKARNELYRVCRTASELDACLDDIAEQANKLCTG